jgi:DNA modification methylase
VYEIRNGDCIREMAKIPSESIDAVITDIPYGQTNCAWDFVIPQFGMWRELLRITKPNAPIVLFAAQPFTSQLICSNIDMYRTNWVWDKVRGTGFQVAKHRPMRRHEDIVVFCKGRANYYPIMTPYPKLMMSNSPEVSSKVNPLKYTDMLIRFYSHKHPTSIIQFSNSKEKSRFHPTQKPVPLMEYLVQTYSLEGDTILDFTCGSGTTGVASVLHGRQFIGIDSDAHYCSVARDRIEKAASKRKAILIS